MKQSVMRRWVKALRSKKYKQGKGTLKYRTATGVTRHCCLGVLCELYQQDRARAGRPLLPATTLPNKEYGANVPISATLFQFGRDKELSGLPSPVMRWAGIKTSTGEWDEEIPGICPDEADCMHVYDLAAWNDAGAAFAEIADFVETNYQHL